jgi:hypothetical protein
MFVCDWFTTATNFQVLICSHVIIILFTLLEVSYITPHQTIFKYNLYSVSADNIWIYEVYLVFITECKLVYKNQIFFKT